MNKITLFLFFAVLLPGLTLSQNFIGAYTNKTPSSSTGTSCRIVTDNMNNVINATTYSGTVMVGSNSFTSNGTLSALIVKRDNNDSILWAKSLGCGNVVTIGGMYTDPVGNLYVTGIFGANGAISTTLDCTPFPLFSADGGNSFIVKYSPAGNVIWSRAIKVSFDTGTANSDLFRISGNGGNMLVITSVLIDVAPQTVGTSTIDTTDGNLFFAVIDDSGTWQYATIFGGNTNLHISMSVAMAANNDIYFSGVFKGSLDLGSAGTLTTLTSSPQDYICKADGAGNFVWAEMLECSSWWRTEVLADNNDAFLLGSFGGTVQIGSTVLSSSYYSAYFSKIDNSGNFLWAKKYGDLEATFYSACRNANSIYLTGVTSFGSPSNVFDTLNIVYTNTLPVANTFSTISYIIQVDLNGNALKGACFSFDFPTLNVNDMACTSSSVYLTGNVTSQAAFGGYVLTSVPINASNYVAHYSDSANFISGTAFYDFNTNSTFDSGDIDANVNLELTDGNYSSTVFANGFYKTGVGIGNYTTSVASPIPYYTYSPLSYSSSFSTLANQEDSLNDFAFQPVPGQNDLVIDLVIGQLRPGFNGVAYVTLKNIGTTTKSGQMTVDLNHPDILINSCAPVAINITGNFATLNYNLNPTELITYTINYTTSASALIGSVVNAIALATDPLDLTPLNNADTINTNITGSYDPNDKRVFPEGAISPAFISNGEQLEYIINFQNTGNDTAFTVVITDSISPLLMLNSFELISSSHPVVVNLYDNHLWFRFYNIYLPDSNVNEPMSHGFVKYKLTPESTCIVGNVIENTAYIYFDYNLPVITNTTYTTIELPSGFNELNTSDFIIYPNPVTGTLVDIKSEQPIELIEIWDCVGRKVQSTSVNGLNETQLNIGNLKHGSYIIRLVSKNSLIVKKLIKL